MPVKHIEPDEHFWKDRRVFLTGHTGFKGAWLSLWLTKMGANVTGYALSPPTSPSLYELCHLEELVTSHIADIRDFESLKAALIDAQPEIVFHLAAQPLVFDSYKAPMETYHINVLGTVHLLEAVRNCSSARAVVNVTTDKCYENREWFWGYRETDPLGGHDPYASSKACAELVTMAYRHSFFVQDSNAPAVASARSGNVIGGGDWGKYRLVPDCLRSFLNGEKVRIRNPQAIRPWQHVLEPLSGYLCLAQQLYRKGRQFAEAWNFGPEDRDTRTVEWVVQRLCEKWGKGAAYEIDPDRHPAEASILKLDCSKARMALGWAPRWNIEMALDAVVEWTALYRTGQDPRRLCVQQIEAYELSSPYQPRSRDDGGRK
nr:CDP-glucose 4,6-dehydratase [Desulfatirhabdium butyrativorans]